MRISDWSSDVCSSDLPRCEPGRVVARQHWHRGLADDRPAVDLLADIVDAAAVQLHAGGQGAGVGVETWKQRQQGGMDVDHAALPVAHEAGRHHAHEAGEADARAEERRVGKEGVSTGRTWGSRYK